MDVTFEHPSEISYNARNVPMTVVAKFFNKNDDVSRFLKRTLFSLHVPTSRSMLNTQAVHQDGERIQVLAVANSLIIFGVRTNSPHS